MTINWHCATCNQNFGPDARAAFLHRQGDDHQVTPKLVARDGEPHGICLQPFKPLPLAAAN